MNLPTLICLVGLPRSGKSTFARSTPHPTVNPDAIRLALHGHRFALAAEPFVWAIALVMIRALFGAGHTTAILDATNTTRKRRNEWNPSTEWQTRFLEFPTPTEECLRRAAGDETMCSVIRRMAAIYEPLGPDEPRWQ